MKAWRISDRWGFDGLKLEDLPEPAPASGEILLRMNAVSVNYRDYLMVNHKYGSMSGELPLVPLSDGVGEVVASSGGDVFVGTRRLPCFNQHWLRGDLEPHMWGGLLGGPLDGTAREFMCAAPGSTVAVPAHLSDVEAASLGCAAVTGWNAIEAMPRGAMDEGTVVVQGTGGVSLFALQFATARNLRVIALSSSDEKLRRLHHLGAAELINYRTVPEWGKEVLNRTGGKGADLVVDVVGGDNLKQSIRAVRDNGTIALVGNVSGSVASINLPHVFMFRKRMIGISTGCVRDFEAMMAFVDSEKLKPVVDERIYDFVELDDAIRSLPRGEHFGKIAVRVGRTAPETKIGPGCQQHEGIRARGDGGDQGENRQSCQHLIVHGAIM